MKIITLLLALVVTINADFEPFSFTGEYHASGSVTNIIEGGVVQPTLSSTLAVSTSTKRMVWNLTQSIYYALPNSSYITLASLPGACFKVSNFSYQAQVDGWSTLRRTLTVRVVGDGGNKLRHAFLGTASRDIGSCCTEISGGTFTDIFGRLNEAVTAQLFPGVTGPGISLRNTIVTSRVTYDYFRSPVESDFVVPPECIPETPLDWCATFYHPFGFCNTTLNVAVPLTI